MSTITCPNCGQTVEAGIRFCPSCGTRIDEQSAPRVAAETMRLPMDDPAPSNDPPPSDPPPFGASSNDPLPPSLPPNTPYDPMGAGSTPPNQGSGQGRNIWLLVGGGGCLMVVLLIACVSIAIFLFGSQLTSAIETELNATSQPAPTAGGGIVPIDSPLAGGAVLLRERFDNPATSVVEASESDTSRYAFEDGGYLIEVNEPETIVWSIIGGPYEDIITEVEIVTGLVEDISAAGLIFNYQDADNFYLFSVADDGTYALEVLENNEWVTLIDWTSSELINTTDNTMGVATQGEAITLYINGVEVDGINDGAFTSGQIGIAVTSFSSGGASVRFDNLVIARNQ